MMMEPLTEQELAAVDQAHKLLSQASDVLFRAFYPGQDRVNCEADRAIELIHDAKEDLSSYLAVEIVTRRVVS